MSRTVNGEMLFDDVAKEVLRRQMWRVADYCGVQIVTYTIMSNHFHVLLYVAQAAPLPDSELLRRFKTLYPDPTKYQSMRLAVVEAELRANGPAAVAWRRRQLSLMGDVSQFMKLLKQRFSIWFNKTHRRFGTLWAERFKSVLVETEDRVRQTMAAYIDLNCVRAGIASDPKEYRFCGYAEAVAGGVSARAGICSVTGGREWDNVQAHYRELLFGVGASPREGKQTVSPSELQRVADQGGRLPLATLLRCRLRYFTDGAVLGSQAFVSEQRARLHQGMVRSESVAARALPTWRQFEDLATLRGSRQQALG